MCFATLLLFPRRLTTSSTGIALTLVKGASQGEGLTLACQSQDGREIDGQVWMVTVSSPGLLLSSNSTPDSCYGSQLIATLGPLSSANPHSASTCQLSDRLTPGMVRPVCAGSQPQQPERVGPSAPRTAAATLCSVRVRRVVCRSSKSPSFAAAAFILSSSFLLLFVLLLLFHHPY